MLWWLVFAALVVVPLALRETRRRQRALPGPQPLALGGEIVGLGERLRGVDAAIDGVRSVIDLANPPTAQACALAALQQARSPESPALASGPGTARFAELLAALSAISAEDLRDLSDLGLDPDKIVATLGAHRQPDNWRQDVLSALDYWQQATSNLRARRYG